jgi:hypothetical protein
MYCSAVGTTLRAAPLAEVELTGQVVRVDGVDRGARGGVSEVLRVPELRRVSEVALE